MFKKSFLTILFFFPTTAFIATCFILPPKQMGSFGVTVYSQNLHSNPPPTNDVISNLQKLSSRQLLDTADYYYGKNLYNTALICYSLLINTTIKDTDVEQQQLVIEALNKSAVIYYYMYDYRSAYDFLIKALLLCEKYNYTSYESKIYTNIGNIYYHFNKYDMAKSYYFKALSLHQDSTSIIVILNNLGAIEVENGKMDSAFYYLDKSLKISKQYDDLYTHSVLNTMASLYQKRKLYDSAFYYYHLSLEDAKKNNKIEKEAQTLSDLSTLFIETNQTDSALFYINLSNTIAVENNFSGTLADNYLTLSKIEESKGHIINAFKYFKKHAVLKDSVFNIEVFGDINQLQRLYEVSKTNQQIEELAVEQHIKERTIYYQKIIQYITLVVLLLVSGVLVYVFFQKRKLNTAYKALVEKNLKIIDLQDNSSEKHPEKYKKSALSDDMQDELLDKILLLMEDTSIICDTEFSLDKLAELVQSNHAYVSQVINDALKKNFRVFLNGYRIREAQRLFSEPNAAKYTIESVALRVGFKSRNGFSNTFKEITGVNPNFYLKSMREQHNA